jgi:hypothetical protein
LCLWVLDSAADAMYIKLMNKFFLEKIINILCYFYIFVFIFYIILLF